MQLRHVENDLVKWQKIFKMRETRILDLKDELEKLEQQRSNQKDDNTADEKILKSLKDERKYLLIIVY